MDRISRVFFFLLKALCIVLLFVLFSTATFSVPAEVHIILVILIIGSCVLYVILEKACPYRNITEWMAQKMKFLLISFGIIMWMLLIKFERLRSYHNWFGKYSERILGILLLAVILVLTISFRRISRLRKDRETALISALEQGDIDRARLLLGDGADPNMGFSESFYKLSLRDKFFTPLMVTVSKNHIDIIRVLLENGADINARNEQGETALALAIPEERFDAVKVLISDGADMDMKSESVFEGKA